MIKIKGKYYRNIQEQVEKNMDDIEVLKKDTKYYGPYDTTSDIPDDYLEDGLQYLIGTEAPYSLYLYDEANNTFHNLGEYPRKGPKGDTGAAAGFGEVSATATGLAAGATPTVNVTESGPNTAKEFAFEFGIPKGDKGDTGSPIYEHVIYLTKNDGDSHRIADIMFKVACNKSTQFESLEELITAAQARQCSINNPATGSIGQYNGIYFRTVAQYIVTNVVLNKTPNDKMYVLVLDVQPYWTGEYYQYLFTPTSVAIELDEYNFVDYVCQIN